MKLYGNPVSTCTRKVLMTLAEKNVAFDFQVIDFNKGEHKSPEFMARQPFGQVPAIEDGDFKLFESRAIFRYLDETQPGAKLTPPTAQGRAEMEQWISVETEDFKPGAMKVIWQTTFLSWTGKSLDEKALAEGREMVGKALDVVDKALAGKEFLAGNQFSLADITYMPYLQYLVAGGQGDLITSRPNVSAWWTRNSTRPTWQKIVS